MRIQSVESTLKGYDKDLRVRWSKQKGRWVVERKVNKGGFNLDRRYDPDSDRYYHIKDGYIHVGDLTSQTEFHEGEVNLILRSLHDGDIWRLGGAGRLNDILDAEYQAEQEKIDYEISQENRDLAGEAWEDNAWKEKRRIVAGVDLKET